MSTARRIIERAFSKAGIRASESPLEASEMADGLDTLNDLLKAYNGTGLLKGVAPVSNVDDDLLEPDESTWMLKANLAIMLAGEYRIPVTQGMAADAMLSKSAWISSSTNLSNIEYPSTLPLGSGNQDSFRSGIDESFFPETDKTNF